jgi:hypothetical protein
VLVLLAHMLFVFGQMATQLLLELLLVVLDTVIVQAVRVVLPLELGDKWELEMQEIQNKKQQFF